MLKLDRLDTRLLTLLSQDARVGIGDLSSALGVARNTVQARLRRLHEEHLLRGFRPDIDLAAAGITVQAFLALEIDQGRLQTVVAGIRALPEALEAHATTGREDLLVRVATEDQVSLQRLIEDVVALPGVIHVNTTLALTTPLSYRISPLLERLTQTSGWGRATPAPESQTET